ncbi:MAG: T9SS type A sorting domain-containing protein, partial [Bacteroidales bacterium]|nr:T9SS type A sorting domain-containing protein [Bacteroidales bacterium]
LSSSGDQVYLTSTTVIEAGTNSLAKVQKSNSFIRLWPNPSKAVLNISFETPVQIKLLEIVNSQGKVLKSINNYNKQLIYLDKIPSGILFLRIHIDDKIYTKTFMKI